MKLNHLSMLAGLGRALIVTASADAAFTWLSIELHLTTAPGQTGGIARDVYRAYANFNNPSDCLTGIFGNVVSPMTINMNGTTAFNPPSGGNVPQNASGVSYAPASQWDSYATIGLAAGYVGDPGANLILSPGFPTFITSAGIINNNNIAWATAGPLPQGLPNAQGRVLIMQFSVNDGASGLPTVNIGINYLAGGTVVTQLFNQTFQLSPPPPPAPGGLAVLGIGVICGGRRRR